MAWIARCDARARTWSPFWFWTYTLIKWHFVLFGAYILVGVGLQSLERKETGLGVAFIVMMVYAGVDLVHTRLATGRWSPDSSRRP